MIENKLTSLHFETMSSKWNQEKSENYLINNLVLMLGTSQMKSLVLESQSRTFDLLTSGLN